MKSFLRFMEEEASKKALLDPDEDEEDATQGQILSQSPTDATSGRWHSNAG